MEIKQVNEFVQFIGGDGLKFEVHFHNSNKGVNDSKMFEDELTQSFLDLIVNRIEIFGYAEAIIYDSEMIEVGSIGREEVVNAA